ncbi:hypothetical protein JNUCC64_13575 [Streptomyces sp. JNUCC 64]
MKRTRAGLAAFEERVGTAARTLLRHQGHDGGWGLTLTSVSSIVNTSEVLPVLRAAGIAGQPVRQALGFLVNAIPDHCRPRQSGGRGEHTRFIAFGLTGLLSHPRFFSHDRVPETTAWCVRWLEEHQVDHGWPEVVGLNDTSLHQTALVVRGLVELRDALHALGPELVFAGGLDTSELLGRVDLLIDHGVHGLLYHRRPSGAWGWRTYVDTAPSPSKTALILLALAAEGRSGPRPDGTPTREDESREVGGVNRTVQTKRLSQVIVEAGRWLSHHHHRWETFVEDDKDVQGTAWEHLAYALCVQAALQAGTSPLDPRLARSWRLMDGLWDEEAGLWSEPGASGGRTTIRAAYYTAAAYEEARRCLARMSVGGDLSSSMDEETDGTVIEHVSLGPGNRILLRTQDREDMVPCALSARLLDLAKTLYHAGESGLTVDHIARALYVAPSSVPKYVQRLNHAVTVSLGGTPARLVVASAVAGASGYRLVGK